MDPGLADRKKQHRLENIQAAMNYVLKSGLPAYKVCTLFNVSKTTLYRHLQDNVTQGYSAAAAVAAVANADVGDPGDVRGDPEVNEPRG